MKKLLIILAISLPVITTSFNVVSCGKHNTSNEITPDEVINKITTIDNSTLKGDNYTKNSDDNLDLTNKYNKAAILNTLGLNNDEQKIVISISGNLKMDLSKATITFIVGNNRDEITKEMDWKSKLEIPFSSANNGIKSSYFEDNNVYISGTDNKLYISKDYGVSYSDDKISNIKGNIEYVGPGQYGDVLIETIETDKSDVNFYLFDGGVPAGEILIASEDTISKQTEITYYNEHYIISSENGIYYSKDGIQPGDTISFKNYWSSYNITSIVGFKKNNQDYLIGTTNDNKQIIAPINNLDDTTVINSGMNVTKLISNNNTVAGIIDGSIYYNDNGFSDEDNSWKQMIQFTSISNASYLFFSNGISETNLLVGTSDGKIITNDNKTIENSASNVSYINQLPDKTLISSANDGTLKYFIDNKN